MSFSIRSLQGHLDDRWAEWFEGLVILTGQVVDQAALHGLLKKVRDLGMPLVSVCPDQSKDFGSTSSKLGEKK